MDLAQSVIASEHDVNFAGCVQACLNLGGLVINESCEYFLIVNIIFIQEPPKVQNQRICTAVIWAFI